MRWSRNAPELFQDAPSREESRSGGRVRTDAAYCWPLGDVKDISVSGARIQCRGACRVQVGQRLPIVIQSGEANAHLWARVVWIRREGFRRHGVALAFDQPSDQIRSDLCQLLKTAAFKHTMI